MTEPQTPRDGDPAGAAAAAARVRAAEAGDKEALLALRCALWPDRDVQRHEVELRVRAQARARHETLLLEDAAGRPCGFAELTREPQEPGHPGLVMLNALFVSPASRRRGAAGMLLAAAERWAHGRGAARLVCELDAGDARAREALQWLGFGDAEERVRVSRSVSVPLEVTRAPAAPAQPSEPAITVQPARSPVFLIVNIMLLAAAVASFAYSDIFAKDALRGVVLPLLDILFVGYFLFLLMVRRYRRRADSSARAERLFRN